MVIIHLVCALHTTHVAWNCRCWDFKGIMSSINKLITSNKSKSNSQVIIANDTQENNNYIVDLLRIGLIFIHGWKALNKSNKRKIDIHSWMPFSQPVSQSLSDKSLKVSFHREQKRKYRLFEIKFQTRKKKPTRAEKS